MPKILELTSSGIVEGVETLPFLLGLAGSEGASLTSEDTLSRRSPLGRCWNLTLRRDLDMVGEGGKGEVGMEWGRGKSLVFMSSCELAPKAVSFSSSRNTRIAFPRMISRLEPQPCIALLL